MKSLTKSAVGTASLLVLSTLLGVLRELVLADRFGTSYIADAYVIAVSLPSVLFTVFASGFAQSYIPVYARLPSERRSTFFSNVCTILFLLSLLVAGACFLCSGTVAQLQELQYIMLDKPHQLLSEIIHEGEKLT